MPQTVRSWAPAASGCREHCERLWARADGRAAPHAALHAAAGDAKPPTPGRPPRAQDVALQLAARSDAGGGAAATAAQRQEWLAAAREAELLRRAARQSQAKPAGAQGSAARTRKMGGFEIVLPAVASARKTTEPEQPSAGALQVGGQEEERGWPPVG